MTAGRERQPLEADHRVAAPVGEPVVAGDHRPHLVAGGARARRVFARARRGDHELIGGEHQLGGATAARARVGRGDEPLAPALALGGERLAGESASMVSHASVDATKRDGRARREVGAEVPGALEIARVES